MEGRNAGSRGIGGCAPGHLASCMSLNDLGFFFLFSTGPEHGA
jgi:hypothetical protein